MSYVQAILLASLSLPHGVLPQTGPQAALLLTEGRSGSTFVGEILNQDPRVLYFYEPCRGLDWGTSPLGAQAARAKVLCEELTIRLLCCNATEGDLRMLLSDWRAVKHDTLLMKTAVEAGALKYKPASPNTPGTLVKGVDAGKLGSAFSTKCRASWRVVKELASRFDAPIPRAVARSIRRAQLQRLAEETTAAAAHLAAPAQAHVFGAEEAAPPVGAVGAGGRSRGGDGGLCAESPNHWACRGKSTAWESTPIKVLHLVRDVRGVIFSRLRLEAFCGDVAPIACARPLCLAMRRTIAAAHKMVSDLAVAEARNISTLGMVSGVSASAAAAAAANAIGSGRSSFYALLRYEDFAKEPVYRASILYQWIGLISEEGSLPRPVATWVERATSAKRIDGDFGVSRADAKQVAGKWATQLPRASIEAITSECVDVLDALRYPVEEYLPPAAASSVKTAVGAIREDGTLAAVAGGATVDGIKLFGGMPGSPTRTPELVSKTALARAAKMFPKGSTSKEGGRVSAKPLIAWTFIESELERIDRTYPIHAKQRALANLGLETRAALRGAFGRMIVRASDSAAHAFQGKASASSTPPPPRFNVAVVGGTFAAGAGGKVGEWTFPKLVMNRLELAFPAAKVSLVDASRANSGSFPAALCLDALVGDVADGRSFFEIIMYAFAPHCVFSVVDSAPAFQSNSNDGKEAEESEADLLLIEYAMDDRCRTCFRPCILRSKLHFLCVKTKELRILINPALRS